MKKSLFALLCLLATCITGQAQIQEIVSHNVTTYVEYDTVTHVKYFHTLLLAEFSPMKTGSAGFKVGFCGKKWGGFFGLDFGYGGLFPPAADSYSSLEQFKYNPDTHHYVADGKQKHFSFGVGVLYRVAKPSYLYAGIGYAGSQRHYIDNFYNSGTVYGGYYMLEPTTDPHFPTINLGQQGAGVQVGCIFRIKKLLLSAGYNTILGPKKGCKTYNDVHFGIGVTL